MNDDNLKYEIIVLFKKMLLPTEVYFKQVTIMISVLSYTIYIFNKWCIHCNEIYCGFL